MFRIPQITDMEIDYATRVAYQEEKVNHVFHVFCDAPCVNDMIKYGASHQHPQCCVSGIIYKQRIVSSQSKLQFGDAPLSEYNQFNPEYNDRVNGTILLNHIIDCMMSSPGFELAKFDVALSDKDFMTNHKSIEHGLNRLLGGIISLPRLVLKNANQMLAEILRNKRDGMPTPDVSVFFYNQKYPTTFPPYNDLFVIYPIPIQLQNYSPMQQDYLNSFFKLFNNREKVRFLIDEIVNRTAERKIEMASLREMQDNERRESNARFARDNEAEMLGLPKVRMDADPMAANANTMEKYFHELNKTPASVADIQATAAHPPVADIQATEQLPEPQPQPQQSFLRRQLTKLSSLTPWGGDRSNRSKRSKKHSKRSNRSKQSKKHSKRSNRKGTKRSRRH